MPFTDTAFGIEPLLNFGPEAIEFVVSGNRRVETLSGDVEEAPIPHCCLVTLLRVAGPSSGEGASMQCTQRQKYSGPRSNVREGRRFPDDEPPKAYSQQRLCDVSKRFAPVLFFIERYSCTPTQAFRPRITWLYSTSTPQVASARAYPRRRQH